MVQYHALPLHLSLHLHCRTRNEAVPNIVVRFWLPQVTRGGLAVEASLHHYLCQELRSSERSLVSSRQAAWVYHLFSPKIVTVKLSRDQM